MAANITRTESEREAYLAQLARRYLECAGHITETQLAAEFGRSQPQIHYDLQILKDRWRANSERDTKEVLDEQLATLAIAQREAFQAWARSKQDKETSVAETVDSQTERNPGKTKKARKQKEGQSGNPQHLANVFKAIEERNRLLGVYAPERYTINGELGINMSGTLAEAIANLGAALRSATAEGRAAIIRSYEQYEAASAALRQQLLTAPLPPLPAREGDEIESVLESASEESTE